MGGENTNEYSELDENLKGRITEGTCKGEKNKEVGDTGSGDNTNGEEREDYQHRSTQ